MPKYSFILLMSFEAATRAREWNSLTKIIQEAGAGQCTLRLFESMADLVISPDEQMPDDIALQTMQVASLGLFDVRNFSMLR